MAAAEFNWPMHQPELPGYSGQVQLQHDVQEAIDGPDLHDTMWWVLPHTANASILLRSIDELQQFTGFYHTTLREGQAWFNLAIPMGGQIRVRICHFVGGYTQTRLNQVVNVSPFPIHRVDFTLLIQCPGINMPPWG